MVTDLSKKKPRGARTYRHMDLSACRRDKESNLKRAIRSPYIWMGIAGGGINMLAFKAAAYLTTSTDAPVSTVADLMNNAGSAMGAILAFSFGHKAFRQLASIQDRIDTSGNWGDTYKTQQRAEEARELSYVFYLTSAVLEAVTGFSKFISWFELQNASRDNSWVHQSEQNISYAYDMLAHVPQSPAITLALMATAMTITSKKLSNRTWNIASASANRREEPAAEVPDALPHLSRQATVLKT